MLSVGDPAPEVDAPTDRGDRFRLSEQRGRSVVLFFYPKASSAGCTREAEAFAQHQDKFESAGVVLVGISVDPVEAQHRFAQECRLPFPLLADTDRSIARQFGVLGILGMARRVTFWIGPDRRIQEVISGLLPGPHVTGMLARLGGNPAGHRPADPRPR